MLGQGATRRSLAYSNVTRTPRLEGRLATVMGCTPKAGGWCTCRSRTASFSGLLFAFRWQHAASNKQPLCRSFNSTWGLSTNNQPVCKWGD